MKPDGRSHTRSLFLLLLFFLGRHVALQGCHEPFHFLLELYGLLQLEKHPVPQGAQLLPLVLDQPFPATDTLVEEKVKLVLNLFVR